MWRLVRCAFMGSVTQHFEHRYQVLPTQKVKQGACFLEFSYIQVYTHPESWLQNHSNGSAAPLHVMHWHQKAGARGHGHF